MFNKKYKDEIARLNQDNNILSQKYENVKRELDNMSKIKEKLVRYKDIDDAIVDRATYLSQIEIDIFDKGNELKEIQSNIITAKDLEFQQSLDVYQTQFRYNDSEEYKSKLKENISYQKDMIKKSIAMCMPKSGAVVLNGKKSDGNNVVKTISTLMLTAFNSYCNQIMDKAKAYDYEKYDMAISNKANKLNDMGSPFMVAISEAYVSLKIEQLEIQVWYKEILEREKEEKRIQREMLKEQEAIDKELEKDRAKLQAEKEKYETMLAKEKNDDKVADLQTALEDVAKRIENNEYRLSNKKCGYLYAISNPDMKDGMVKIGVTRRAEPMVRVAELSNASHAFIFNVHALVFSEDVFTLENNMHKYLAGKRVNLANARKEFFYASLSEVAEALAHFGYKTDIDYNPVNEQYLLSESMRVSK